MKKFKLNVRRKNRNVRKVTVYLDEKTARILELNSDKKLLEAYLLEEYKSSRRDRQENWWNSSLEEKLENGRDFVDNTSYDTSYALDNFDNEELQPAIKQLNARQQELLRLLYIECKAQTEIAELYGVGKQAISNAIKRTHQKLKKILEKNKNF